MNYRSDLHNLMKAAGLPLRHVKQLDRLHGHEWHRSFWLAQDTINQGDSVLMLGRPGTGKTQTAVVIAMNLIRSLQSVRYYKAADLYGKTREALNAWNEQDAIRRAVAPALLVIDEAGQSRLSDYEQRTLFRIFDARYDACRPTIIISNQTKQALASAMHPALIDRLAETATCIEPGWSSYRLHPDRGATRRPDRVAPRNAGGRQGQRPAGTQGSDTPARLVDVCA